ncbi:MAG TPA: hypothetical protein VKQ08_07585 [Cyclobacteriaceae bacterium]|nr:hypothetical protein [Cyclobacteriaceae bacterium]
MFKVILGMDRTIIDNHIEWKQRSQTESQKAFIIGRTIADESPNPEGVFFNEKIKGGRQNVFLFGIEPSNERPVIVIHRLDQHFKALFRGPLPTLDEINQLDMAQWNDPAKRQGLCDRVRHLRALPGKELQQQIKSQTLCCIGNYALSCHTAELAYALMLVETNHKDPIEMQKFTDNHQNLFGDANVIRDALFFGATILSKDKHIRKMAAYCHIRCHDEISRPAKTN